MKKLLWLDIETTGLDPHTGEVLEVGMMVTDLDLNVIDSIEIVIKHDLDDIKSICNDFVTNMHTANNLFRDVGVSKINELGAELQLFQFVKKHFSDSSPELHGNTVHFDKKWLEVKMPTLSKLFNYRIVDVSSIKVLLSNHAPVEFSELKALINESAKLLLNGANTHRVLADIAHSIIEYKAYLTHLELLKGG